MSTYADNVNQLTRQYNDAIRALENAFDMEAENSNISRRRSSLLKRQYSKQYEALVREYQGKRRQLFNAYKQANPQWARRRTILGWVFIVGILAAMTCCIGQMPEDQSAPSALAQQTQEWNADNIPMPHLQDASQYVSNPDNVLTSDAVNRMNTTLQLLDSELGIESVVIVVNHIENDDPFRMAQDVGNKYGVGKQDRGLVIVVGYQDHSINMSPGRALEADLTDAECHRLEQQYVVPAMRAEMPDSGMIYLTEAIYSTLKQKELPQMSNLTSASDELDDEAAGIMAVYFILLMGWCIFYLVLNRKYQWLGLLGATSLLSNPFYESTSGGGVFIGGGGGHSGFGGGGGFSGGSFGGGSFGGGGATSRW